MSLRIAHTPPDGSEPGGPGESVCVPEIATEGMRGQNRENVLSVSIVKSIYPAVNRQASYASDSRTRIDLDYFPSIMFVPFVKDRASSSGLLPVHAHITGPVSKRKRW